MKNSFTAWNQEDEKGIIRKYETDTEILDFFNKRVVSGRVSKDRYELSYNKRNKTFYAKIKTYQGKGDTEPRTYGSINDKEPSMVVGFIADREDRVERFIKMCESFHLSTTAIYRCEISTADYEDSEWVNWIKSIILCPKVKELGKKIIMDINICGPVYNKN